MEMFGNHGKYLNFGKWKKHLPAIDTQSRLGNVLIVSMTNIPFLAKAHALLAVSMRERGYCPLIVCLSSSHWAKRYFSLFGLHDLIYWDQCLANFSPADGEERRLLISSCF